MASLSLRTSSLVGAVAATALAVGAVAGPLASGRGGPPPRAPEPAVKVIEARTVAQLQGPAAAGDYDPLPESPAFSRDGKSLYWVSVFGHRGHSLWRHDLRTGRQTPIEVWERGNPDYAPGYPAVAVHKDGSLYGADFFNQKVTRIDPRTGESTDVVTAADVDTEHFAPDDLVFDSSGNLFISDMQGDVTDPRGRVYRLSPSGELTVLVDNISAPNGVALSADDQYLWVADYHGSRLLRVTLDEDGNLSSQFWADMVEVMGHFSGPGLPDSNTVDSDGNVYQAFYRGGRAVVMGQEGGRVAEIRLAGGNKNYMLTTNMVIRPGGTEAYLVAGGKGGARLYRFTALAKGIVPFSHQ